MFQKKELSLVSYANLFSMWYYKTTDKLDYIDGDYFTGCENLFNEGDMLVIARFKDISHNKGFIGKKICFVRKIDFPNKKIYLT